MDTMSMEALAIETNAVTLSAGRENVARQARNPLAVLENKINQLLNDERLSADCRAELKAFDKSNERKRLALKSRINYINAGFILLRCIGKPVRQAEKKDFEKYLDYLNKEGYSPLSIKRWIGAVKQYAKFAYDTEEYPACVKWIKVQNVDELANIDPEDMLSLEDIQKLVSACPSIRLKACVSLLFWSGCRVSEFTGIKLKTDIKVIDGGKGMAFTVTGKTGTRTVAVYDANTLLYLKEYINCHELKHFENPYLFYTRNNGSFGQRMTAGGMYQVLQPIGKRAGITKSVNPHNFRHSLACYYKSLTGERTVSDDVLMKHFGWRNREMITRYGNLCKRKVFTGIAAANGIQTEKVKNEESPKPIRCRCGVLNPADTVMCISCHSSLNHSVIKEEFNPALLPKDQLEKYLDFIEERLAQRRAEQNANQVQVVK